MASNFSIASILKPGSTTAASAASAAAVNLPAPPLYPQQLLPAAAAVNLLANFTPPLCPQQLQLIRPQVLPLPVPMPQPPPALIPVGTGDEESTRRKDQKDHKNDQKDQNKEKKDQKKKRKRKREKLEEQLNGKFFYGFSCILFSLALHVLFSCNWTVGTSLNRTAASYKQARIAAKIGLHLHIASL